MVFDACAPVLDLKHPYFAVFVTLFFDYFSFASLLAFTAFRRALRCMHVAGRRRRPNERLHVHMVRLPHHSQARRQSSSAVTAPPQVHSRHMRCSTLRPRSRTRSREFLSESMFLKNKVFFTLHLSRVYCVRACMLHACCNMVAGIDSIFSAASLQRVAAVKRACSSYVAE